jgi:DNA gyrase subunit B
MSTFKAPDAIEAVRLHPGMYFGGTNSRSLCHLVDEILKNVIHQVHVGGCRAFSVTVLSDQSLQISDEGQGIPVHAHQNSGKRILEIIMSPSGGGYDAQTDTFHRTLHRVGLIAVCAVSQEFHIEVKRDGMLWEQHYSRGHKQTELTSVRPLTDDEATGTTLTLTLDPEIFQDTAFDAEWIEQRLYHLSYLLGGTTIFFEDQRSEGQSKTFLVPDGLISSLKELNSDTRALHDPIMFRDTVTIQPDQRASYDIALEVAFQFLLEESPQIVSYVNTEQTAGGMHVDGFIEGLSSVLLRKQNYTLVRGDWPDLMKHLTAIVSIWHPTPRFESQSDLSLLNIDARRTVYRSVYDQLDAYLDKNPALMQSIINQGLMYRAERQKRSYRMD